MLTGRTLKKKKKRKKKKRSESKENTYNERKFKFNPVKKATFLSHGHQLIEIFFNMLLSQHVCIHHAV